MSFPLQLQSFDLGAREVKLYVPQLKAVQQWYQQKAKVAPTPFPYWAQVWPAAMALARFIVQHPKYTHNKNVLELAAGLGLPSLTAAALAQNVTCTDYIFEAVEVVQQSAQYNKLTNLQGQTLDWNYLPTNLQTDVLLLSDVNYEPQQFNVLFGVLQQFLQQGTTIILSTPQRLMAKPFITSLEPWCRLQQQIEVPQPTEAVAITVLVLKR